MQKTEVPMGKWIEAGFYLYKDNFITLVLATLIGLVLCTVSFGILTGPMLAGLIIIALQLLRKEEPKPEAGAVFKGFSFFLNSFLFMIVWGIAILIGSILVGWVPFIGQLFSLFLIFTAQAFLMFGLYLIVDKQMPFWPASQLSIQTVKTNFWPFFCLATIASIIGSIGSLAFGIGVVLTFPIQICILAIAYQEIFNPSEPSATPDFTSEEPF